MHSLLYIGLFPEFNLNFEENPNIQYIPNIIQTYHDALNRVKLWGPTNF